MHIVIGIISYNRLSYLQDLLYSIRDSIKDNKDYKFTVIVSDDLSTDGTVSWVKEEAISKCLVNYVIEANARGGVARNSNRILELFLELEGDRLYLLNDDIKLESPDVFKVYENAIEKTGYEFFAYTDDHSVYPGSIIHKNGIALKKRAQGDGVCLVMTRRVVETLGGFDVKYGLLGQEHNDYALRAQLAGFCDGVLDVVEAQRKIYCRQYYEIVPYSIPTRYTHIAIGNKYFIDKHLTGFNIYESLET